MSGAVRAYRAEDDSVIYEYDDGTREKWSGGTLTWRCQNPGNIMDDPRNNWLGLIGVYGKRLCIFDDYEMGARAVRKTLASYAKQNKDLEKAIHDYAPPVENDTDIYIKNVCEWTGIDRKALLSQFSASQMESVVQAIFRQEGWTEGIITILPKDVKRSPLKGMYIWHTEQDEKVRPEHAERDGKTFNFARPPQGGNPGDDYNCRCWAEPIPEKSLKQIFKK